MLPYPYHGLADVSLMEGEQMQSLGLLTQSLIYMPESSKASFIDTCNQLIEASSSSSFFIKVIDGGIVANDLFLRLVSPTLSSLTLSKLR